MSLSVTVGVVRAGGLLRWFRRGDEEILVVVVGAVDSGDDERRRRSERRLVSTGGCDVPASFERPAVDERVNGM